MRDKPGDPTGRAERAEHAERAERADRRSTINQNIRVCD